MGEKESVESPRGRIYFKVAYLSFRAAVHMGVPQGSVILGAFYSS